MNKVRDEFLLKPITAPVFKHMVGVVVVVVVCVSECMQWWLECGRRQTVSVDTGSCSGSCVLLTNPTRPILLPSKHILVKCCVSCGWWTWSPGS